MIKRCLAASLLCVPMAVAANAHVTLETTQAPIGSSYKAVFKVGHGCAGSPTTRIRVRIPEGMIGVKPMPKAGWMIDVVQGRYERGHPYFEGRMLTEGVKEVVWSGGSLPDAHYDEFVLTGVVSAALEPGTTLYFPVVQDCAQGVHRWIEIPAAGKNAGDHKEPAPGVTLMPKRGSAP